MMQLNLPKQQLDSQAETAREENDALEVNIHEPSGDAK
jgi:hypothetical protein